ncbi:MAG: isoprenylcysteine carboxylmethyltransferase family protein [Alphaproteobacteria bacterium]|jgi:protein-S-isoprenylcysteine O-methyltransferase Ste14|nr:isoprenylcysteine carboxylmethyltransferase family protein [Alphaproteobacteria bacterium]
MTSDQNGDQRGDQPTDSPGVIALPPVIFVTALVVGFAVEWLSPSMIIDSGSRIAAGIVVPLGGIVMIALGILQHRRSGNDPDPRNPDVTVMTSGIYQRTRNPIYIGYILVLAGIGLAANSMWVLVTVIPAYFVVRWGVIAREEAYLEAKFGQTYMDYKSSVRRWF